MKILKILAITILIVGVAGCNSMGKVEHSDGRVEKVPQDVGVVQALAPMMEKCKLEKSTGFTPTTPNDCKTATGVGDKAECFRSNANIATMNTMGLMAEKLSTNNEIPCAESVAKVGVAYFNKEAVQAKELGKGTKFVAGTIAAYKMTEALVKGFVAGSATGDTNVNEINVSANNPAGAGSEGTGGDSGDLNQYVNIGSGKVNGATRGSVMTSGEKPIIGDENTFDDSGDGSNNNPGIFN